jgi:hypothetical protein
MRFGNVFYLFNHFQPLLDNKDIFVHNSNQKIFELELKFLIDVIFSKTFFYWILCSEKI